MSPFFVVADTNISNHFLVYVMSYYTGNIHIFPIVLVVIHDALLQTQLIAQFYNNEVFSRYQFSKC